MPSQGLCRKRDKRKPANTPAPATPKGTHRARVNPREPLDNVSFSGFG